MSQDEGIGMRWTSLLAYTAGLIAVCTLNGDRAIIAMLGFMTGSSLNSLMFGYALERGYVRRIPASERLIAGGGK